MMTSTRRFSISWWAWALVVLAGCNNLDPKNIVMARYPLERLSETLHQYKGQGLSPEEKRLLGAFIARAELKASIAGVETDVVGKRLHEVLSLQKSWALAHQSPGETDSAQDGATVTLELARLDPGLYPTKDLWPRWTVDRYEIRAELENTTQAPIKSISGTFVAEDGQGNPVARFPGELNVPEREGAIAPGKSYRWTFPVEVDRFAPCQKTGENVAQLGEALRGFLEAYERQAKAQATLDELDAAESPDSEITPAREQVIEAAKVRADAARQVQKVTGHAGPGKIVSGVNGRRFYLPSEPLEVCPRETIDQVVPRELMTGLRLRWTTERTTAGQPTSEAPSAPEPAEEPAAPAPGAATEPDAGAAPERAPDAAP